MVGLFFVIGKPSPVCNIDVKDVTANNVTIIWQPPEDDGGKSVVLYLVEKRDVSCLSWSIVGEAQVLEFLVTDLSENHQYVFRVFAQNGVGLSDPVESKIITSKKAFGGPNFVLITYCFK